MERSFLIAPARRDQKLRVAVGFAMLAAGSMATIMASHAPAPMKSALFVGNGVPNKWGRDASSEHAARIGLDPGSDYRRLGGGRAHRGGAAEHLGPCCTVFLPVERHAIPGSFFCGIKYHLKVYNTTNSRSRNHHTHPYPRCALFSCGRGTHIILHTSIYPDVYPYTLFITYSSRISIIIILYI